MRKRDTIFAGVIGSQKNEGLEWQDMDV